MSNESINLNSDLNSNKYEVEKKEININDTNTNSQVNNNELELRERDDLYQKDKGNVLKIFELIDKYENINNINSIVAAINEEEKENRNKFKEYNQFNLSNNITESYINNEEYIGNYLKEGFSKNQIRNCNEINSLNSNICNSKSNNNSLFKVNKEYQLNNINSNINISSSKVHDMEEQDRFDISDRFNESNHYHSIIKKKEKIISKISASFYQNNSLFKKEITKYITEVKKQAHKALNEINNKFRGLLNEKDCKIKALKAENLSQFNTIKNLIKEANEHRSETLINVVKSQITTNNTNNINNKCCETCNCSCDHKIRIITESNSTDLNVDKKETNLIEINNENLSIIPRRCDKVDG